MSYGGGGFMGGGSQRSDDSPGGKKNGPQALRPVTIHQILQAEQPYPDAEFVIDGAETKDVSFVACVRNIGKSPTNISLLVEDGTGQIDARKWVESSSDDESEDLGIEQNVYVRIIGTLKTFNGKKHINCTHLRKVDDMNEVLYHAVECVYVSLFTRHGGPPSGSTNGAAPRIASTTNPSNPYQNASAAAEPGGAGPGAFNDLQPVQRKIMLFIAKLNEEGDVGEGVNVNSIARETGTSAGKVKQEVDNLVNDGHLYYTIDDDHVLGTA